MIFSQVSAPAKESAAILNADPHLVGWWRFDETRGKTAADSAKPRHPASLEGGLSFDTHSVDGRIGKALKLDGSKRGRQMYFSGFALVKVFNGQSPFLG